MKPAERAERRRSENAKWLRCIEMPTAAKIAVGRSSALRCRQHVLERVARMPLPPTRWVALAGLAVVLVVYLLSRSPSQPVALVNLSKPAPQPVSDVIPSRSYANCALNEEIRQLWASTMQGRDEAERPWLEANLVQMARSLCGAPQPDRNHGAVAR